MTDNYLMTHRQARDNRALAIALGENKYLGNPCPKQHDGMRYTKTHNCVQCTRSFARVARYQGKMRYSYRDHDGVLRAARSVIQAEKHHLPYFKMECTTDLTHINATFRSKDIQCMSCLQKEKRAAKRKLAHRNRTRYVPVWLR